MDERQDGMTAIVGFPVTCDQDGDLLEEASALIVTAEHGGVLIQAGDAYELLTTEAALELAAGIEALAYMAQMGKVAWSGPILERFSWLGTGYTRPEPSTDGVALERHEDGYRRVQLG